MNSQSIARRAFLQSAATIAGAVMIPISPRTWAASADDQNDDILRFGIISDVHQDVIHDAEDRLRAFVEAMTEQKVDFIIQLGDFCIPKPGNKPFLDIWNTFQGPRYHVLGNHDMDGGYQREQTVAFWGMPDRHYTFDHGDIRFIVLDGNDPGGSATGYARHIAQDQADWLAQTLKDSPRPVIVFCHQPLDHDKSGVENGQAMREILQQANDNAGLRKIIACISGHRHRDYCKRIDGIDYLQINSASYHWLGSRHARERYGKEIHAAHPYLANTIPYKDPLWALATVDRRRGFFQIEGRVSEFVGPPPWGTGADRSEFDADTLVPAVSDWKWPL